MTRAYVSWSSGKDSAFALHEARRAGIDVAGLLTTVNETHARVAMHGVRDALLDRQAHALGLPILKVPIPHACSNAIYEQRMAVACDTLKGRGIRNVIFGDLFLEDLRRYRIDRLAEISMTAMFPLWKRDTAVLARDMICSGLVAHIACLDPHKLPRSFAGRRFDDAMLDDLPADVDPCGENGEFHTVVTAGPMFASQIDTEIGETVERDGFVFTDIIPR